MTRWKSIGFILALSLGSTLIAFGVSRIVPQGERVLADWQLAHMAPGPVDPSIVLVTAREKSPAFCGDGQWDFAVLESTLLALHEAGAVVIAPSIEVSMPFAPGCGGLPGLVRLAEVTKRVGSVVFPDSVPPSLAEVAIALGNLALVPEMDGVFRGITFLPRSVNSSPHLPFGLTIATIALKTTTTVIPKTINHQLQFVGRWTDSPFPNYAFSNVWHIIQGRNLDVLTQMFRGKIVVLFGLGTKNPSYSTPWEKTVPVEYLHALLTNAVLTNGWISTPPFWAVFMVTGCVGMFFAFLFFRHTSFTRLGLKSLAAVSLAGLTLVWGLRQGWVWPILTTGLAWTIIISGTIFWRTRISQWNIQRRIIQGQQQVGQLEKELAEKQHDVHKLEKQLHAVQHYADQSVTVIQGLQSSQSGFSRQLEISQAEMENTRRQIDRLQEELRTLRQQVPASQEALSAKTHSSDSLALEKECASFQILTRDPLVLRVYQDLKKAAVTQRPILLLGETGTGKEIFAKAAHALSPRHRGPFVSVNMAAIGSELFEGELFGHIKGAFTGAVGREGFIETANGGTLFLDEVGELPFNLQAKLLRFLEDGSFHRVGESRMTQADVRIIAATNCDLQKEVEEGRYRGDLYYRLRSIVLTLPPLRQRRQEDRLLLAQWFLQHFSGQQHERPLAFTQGALEAIGAYQWPGNIRELRQTVAQAVALANDFLITESDLNLSRTATPAIEGEGQGKEELGRLEDSMVLECLRRHAFDMQATAKALGWDRSTVTQRLKGLGFQALVLYQGNVEAAARSLAGDVTLNRVVEGRLREYSKNLLSSTKRFSSVEEAVADCRKRFRNLPERHFPAVEQLVRIRFSRSEKHSSFS